MLQQLMAESSIIQQTMKNFTLDVSCNIYSSLLLEHICSCEIFSIIYKSFL